MLTLLFTGWSGAGKSTLAGALSQLLQKQNYKVAVIDGDQYRDTLNKDLGFSEADRRENIRRLMNVALEKNREGYISIVAAINPFEDQRQELCQNKTAYIVYIKCAPEVLLQRDTKGLYKRALLPEHHPDKINNLTGINDRYDVPENPHLVIDTAIMPVEEAAKILYHFVISTLHSNA
ncbi:MAG: adenylyl-sulfate kinase [Chitinophagaceae bacterium]|nr:MAG: adenylyl-sulfate kinase [Chitinophagaceae bacterium]